MEYSFKYTNLKMPSHRQVSFELLDSVETILKEQSLSKLKLIISFQTDNSILRNQLLNKKGHKYMTLLLKYILKTAL